MLRDEVFKKTLEHYLAPIRPFLDDPSISEVMINGPEEVFIERKGRLERTPARFSDESSLQSAVKNIAQFVGRTINEDSPRLDARLPDGSRVHAVFPPCARRGTYVSIRKFAKETLTIDKLIGFGALTAEGREFLDLLVNVEKNIIVAGGTGSGKTSMLNAMSAMIPPTERVLVIEDSTELQLQREHVVQMETKTADRRGRGRVSIRDLFHSALRMRPDRIVIGEIRGEEALDLIQALSSGHGGSMSTLHANSPVDTLYRLETMALLSGVEIPLFALRAQIASSVQIVVHVSRFLDGSRKLVHISEVLPMGEGTGYRLQDLYVFREKGRDPSGKVLGELTWTGITPTFADAPAGKGLSDRIDLTRRVWSRPAAPAEAARG